MFFFLNVGFLTEATFTMSMKGHLKLVHGDFEYNKNYVKGELTYWRCVKRQQCRAKAVSCKFGQRSMVKFYGAHTHLPFSGTSNTREENF